MTISTEGELPDSLVNSLRHMQQMIQDTDARVHSLHQRSQPVNGGGQKKPSAAPVGSKEVGGSRCKVCGKVHDKGVTTCPFVKGDGTMSIKRLAEAIAGARDPAYELGKTLYEDWPQSERFCSASVATVNALKASVDKARQTREYGGAQK